jgi:hypothetical protein
VKNLLNKFETEIEIAYKPKKQIHKIEIGYMINPKNFVKIVVKYFDKK